MTIFGKYMQRGFIIILVAMGLAFVVYLQTADFGFLQRVCEISIPGWLALNITERVAVDRVKVKNGQE